MSKDSERVEKAFREESLEAIESRKNGIISDLCVDKSGKIIERAQFTYLEYLEFSSVEEFKKFKNETPITRKDIETINWDDLTEKLEGAA